MEELFTNLKQKVINSKQQQKPQMIVWIQTTQLGFKKLSKDRLSCMRFFRQQILNLQQRLSLLCYIKGGAHLHASLRDQLLPVQIRDHNTRRRHTTIHKSTNSPSNMKCIIAILLLAIAAAGLPVRGGCLCLFSSFHFAQLNTPLLNTPAGDIRYAAAAAAERQKTL